MSAAITNMALMFGAMQVAKKIPFDDNPEIVVYARLGYVSAQLLCLGVFYYCSIRVKRANDLTVLKYVEPKSPMSQEPGELVTTTHKDYDLADINKAMRGVFMGMLFVGFMHLYMGYTQPLVIQSILPLKNALESKQAQLWVWGKPATGELKRPFKAAPGLFGMQGSAGPQTDKAAIREAEIAGGAAAKKAE
ncbi:putative PHO88-involved in phosphate transport [Tilletiaria anomala UBC 951]|uniref:Putative PHO88-involved in phosphate transport n=1 Tax=Tilletiaria anomala (strain ATCC 24038 / CBS 436.72 / UBC 951) TaxID=1037660 RepID=A0A066W7D4_TILAU|nr:putative PHO88-involved in phosphate transport [Tilletiaria anomala UBC 951]KDN46999.1 putative PHO88-involved in phosphate transport [Tilletiaria anomala UBC 951]